MVRGRVLILGAEQEELPLTTTLRAAGYAVSCSRTIAVDPAPQVVIVVGPMLLPLCRAARARFAAAHVIACLPSDDDPAQGECLAAGADDVMALTLARVTLLARVRSGTAQVELRERIERERRHADLLEDLAAALSDTDLTDGLCEAAARVAEVFAFTRCAVLVLPGDDPGMLYVVAASDEPALSRMPLDLRKYPELRAALEAHEPVFVDDAARSTLLGEHGASAAENGARSLLVLPMVVNGRAVGVVQLRSAEGRAPLDKVEMKVLRQVSRLVALALRDGRIETLRDQTRRMFALDFPSASRMRAIEQHSEFFESAADGMVVVDARGEVLYMNRAAEQLTGYARTGLTGRRFQDLVGEAQREGLSEVLAQAATGFHLAGFDLELITTSGEPLRVSVSTSRVLAEHDAVVLAFRDVTLARALEEELRKTKDFLERLVDSTVDAIIAVDIRGRVIVFNRGAENLTGYAAVDVIGRLPVTKLYPDGEAREVMAQLRSPEHGGPGRLLPTRREILARDGTRIPVSLTASILYEDGREVASVGVVSDLRERLHIEQRLAQAQEQLLASEKQALIADLAGTTAHELNQPLTSVMGYAELLKTRIPADDSNTRAVDIILREAERMAAIVRKIGRITRYETKPYVGSTTILDLDKSATEG